MTGWPQGRLEDPAEGSGYGDMTPIISHKIKKEYHNGYQKVQADYPGPPRHDCY